MEEDKKYLKDQIKRIKLEYMPCELFVFDRLIQAIENILNRLEQDERVIEEMTKYIDTYTYRDGRDGCDFEMLAKCTCNHKDCNKCIIDHFRKKCE